MATAQNVANALIYGYLNRAVALHADGYANPHDIDTAMRLGCGLPRGPFEELDMLRLDVVHGELATAHQHTGTPPAVISPLLTKMVDNGSTQFHEYTDAGERIDPTDSAGTSTLGGQPARRITRVGVLGSGTMARGIAQTIAVAGLPVVLVAREIAKADKAFAAVDASLTKAASRGKLSDFAKKNALALLRVTAELAELSGCDVVIEAAAEELTVKREIFTRLGEICRPDAVLATTTSSLSVSACAQASGRAADVIGLHFFNPAPVMRLVEVVATADTADNVLATALALCARLRKTAVPCGDQAGFIVNRLLFPYLNDAINSLEHHGLPAADIDAAVEELFEYPMGPFTLLDAIGLDVSLAIQNRLHDSFPTPGSAPATVLEKLVADGRLGRKSGGGFRC